MDMGGYVIIINADKVTVTGNKFNDKLYRSHPTSKPGTLKVETFRQVNEVGVAALHPVRFMQLQHMFMLCRHATCIAAMSHPTCRCCCVVCHANKKQVRMIQTKANAFMLCACISAKGQIVARLMWQHMRSRLLGRF